MEYGASTDEEEIYAFHSSDVVLIERLVVCAFFGDVLSFNDSVLARGITPAIYRSPVEGARGSRAPCGGGDLAVSVERHVETAVAAERLADTFLQEGTAAGLDMRCTGKAPLTPFVLSLPVT